MQILSFFKFRDILSAKFLFLKKYSYDDMTCMMKQIDLSKFEFRI